MVSNVRIMEVNGKVRDMNVSLFGSSRSVVKEDRASIVLPGKSLKQGPWIVPSQRRGIGYSRLRSP